MKKKELYVFLKGLQSAKFKHPRVTHAINKNKRMVEEAIEDMEKDNIEQSDELKNFTKEREELAKEFCKKDESGNPKIKQIPKHDGTVQMMYDLEDQHNEKSPYRKKLTALEKKYKEEIEKHEVKIKLYNEEFLNDDTDYEPFMLELEVLEAHEICPQYLMDTIYWMIKEPKKQK